MSLYIYRTCIHIYTARATQPTPQVVIQYMYALHAHLWAMRVHDAPVGPEEGAGLEIWLNIKHVLGICVREVVSVQKQDLNIDEGR